MSSSPISTSGVSRLDHSANESLMRALDGSAEHLADEVFLLFCSFMPEAHGWPESRRNDFVAHARGRLQAILAIVGLTTEVDRAICEDLEAVGANAAMQGSSLPHLLIVLRISRDLLTQTALRLGREEQGRLDDAITVFLARLLPVVDRLTDGISTGYYEALLDEMNDERHRLSTIVESKPEAVYEADFDGVLRYVNTAFSLMVGQPADRVVGRPLADVLPAEGSVIGALLSEPAEGSAQVQVAMKSADGVLRPYEITTVVRRIGSEILGFGGIVRRTDQLTAISL